MAARSERFTASAFQPTSSGAKRAAEVDALDHRVHGGDQKLARRRAEHRGVVADPHHDALARGAGTRG